MMGWEVGLCRGLVLTGAGMGGGVADVHNYPFPFFDYFLIILNHLLPFFDYFLIILNHFLPLC